MLYRRWMLALLPLWGACSLSASTKVFSDTADRGLPGGGAAEGGGAGSTSVTGSAGDGGADSDGLDDDGVWQVVVALQDDAPGDVRYLLTIDVDRRTAAVGSGCSHSDLVSAAVLCGIECVVGSTEEGLGRVSLAHQGHTRGNGDAHPLGG